MYRFSKVRTFSWRKFYEYFKYSIAICLKYQLFHKNTFLSRPQCVTLDIGRGHYSWKNLIKVGGGGKYSFRWHIGKCEVPPPLPHNLFFLSYIKSILFKNNINLCKMIIVFYNGSGHLISLSLSLNSLAYFGILKISPAKTGTLL